MDLGEFLLARIAEDEQVARAAAEDVQWRVDGPPVTRWSVVTRDYEGIGVGEAGGDEGDGTSATTEHMQRHDPARVLAECEAKRRIVWEHRPESETQDGIEFYPGHLCLTCGAVLPCATLRLLALPYADHPDFCPEWSALTDA